jgi:hypothetical protein
VTSPETQQSSETAVTQVYCAACRKTVTTCEHRGRAARDRAVRLTPRPRGRAWTHAEQARNEAERKLSEAVQLEARALVLRVPLALPLGPSYVATSEKSLAGSSASPQATGGELSTGRSPGPSGPRLEGPRPESGSGWVAGTYQPGGSNTPRLRPPGVEHSEAELVTTGTCETSYDSADALDPSGEAPPPWTTPLCPAEGAFRVLQVRVDCLVIAFRLELKRDVLGALASRIKDAGPGFVEVELGGASFKGKACDKPGAYRLENDSLIVMVDVGAAERWAVKCEFPGEKIARTTPDRAVELARRFAGALGAIQGERVRRIDLCVDVEGWDVQTSADVATWIKPRTAKWGKFHPERDGGDVLPKSEVYVKGQRITGITICPGGDMMARNYDKVRELAIREKGKRDDELDRWRAAGWDGEKPVARFEFQIRGPALYEMATPDGRNLRDGAETALRNLDRIWAYLVGKPDGEDGWIRLIEPDTATRKTRATIDPRWRLLQRIAFTHAADRVQRVRRRGHASAGQSLGASLSLAASAGDLPPIWIPSRGVVPIATVRDERAAVGAMSDAACSAQLGTFLRAIMHEAADTIASDLVARFEGNPRNALAHVLIRARAAQARFYRVEPPP